MSPRSLIFLVLGIAAVGGGYYVYTSTSYGPLEQRVGQVTSAQFLPAHDEYRYERDEHGNEHRVTRRVDDAWRVVISWEGGTYESKSGNLFSEVQVGSEVTMHVRRRLWRGTPYGWSVQAVTVR
jgi:hypothetical protein